MAGGTVFRVSAAAYEVMVAAAEADYPEETCGLVFTSTEGSEVVPMRNAQNEQHRADPGRFPRDARTAYYLDPVELQRVLDARDREGMALRAIYHSHPDHEAYFSETDSEAAAPFGEPSYPGALYLVLSVRHARVTALKAFDWSSKHGRYVEVPVEVTETGAC